MDGGSDQRGSGGQPAAADGARETRLLAASAPASPLAWPVVHEAPAVGSARSTQHSARSPSRVLIGGVGYTNLRDRSFGPLMVERLARQAWPPDVVLEDLSYGPIDVLFKLQAEPRPFRLGVFIGAVARGRPPGTVERYLWNHPTPAADELQARIAEAITGVVSLENLLHILTHFGALPRRTVAIEVEPAAEEAWGAALSPPVYAALERVEELVRDELAAAGVEGGR